ncbi:uncharacterized protein [Battus philenor]|uniref:uncharacterized protein n=1 Tax=Battus philenor TaxID=42288 RepID=UPI0035CFEA8E
MMEQEKRLIIELLQLYRDFPCLWDHTHLLYNNREAREQAYNVVLEKYKAIREDATLENLKKKLENMRATYKREYKKVQAARNNGEREHRPTLWYYKYFTFLDNSEDQIESETNASVDNDHIDEIEEYHSDFEGEDEPKPKKSRNIITRKL